MEKLPKKRTVIRKLSITFGVAPPYLCLWQRNFCAAEGRFFGYSGAILERLGSLFIDYSNAKCAYFALKTAAAQKSLF